MIFVGEFGLGLKQGFGRYTFYSSGDIYEGEWQNDQPHGQGTYTYSCGEVFRGEYHSGKKNGLGKYRFDDGTTMNAIWENDEVVQELPPEDGGARDSYQPRETIVGDSPKKGTVDTDRTSILDCET